MPSHVLFNIPSSHIHVFTPVCPGSFALDTLHSLRQLGEMPSLAGPKSRAHLASFTRLDDGAFCRVISAACGHHTTPAAPLVWVQLALRMVSWHLLCHWPIACVFFASSPHRTPVPPIVLDRHIHMAWCDMPCGPDFLVRFPSTAEPAGHLGL